MNFMILAALCLMAFLSQGCAATFERVGQVLQKEMNGGYPAKITLYSTNGTVLQQWESERVLPIADTHWGDPSLTFMIDGKKNTILGIYTIEEK